MSSTGNKAYQRVDKFKEDEGMFEDAPQDDNSKFIFERNLTQFRNLQTKNWQGKDIRT
jgi:hypothetical protein